MNTNRIGTTLRVAHAKRPTKGIFGTNLRWRVLSMALPKIMRSPGMTRKTLKRLQAMALMSTKPRSAPRRNFMNVMAVRPAIVVRLEAKTSGTALASARSTLSRMAWLSCSSL